MLQQVIISSIECVAGQNINEIWFQQDGAPTQRNREYLNEKFPNRWIQRREWPL